MDYPWVAAIPPVCSKPFPVQKPLPLLARRAVRPDVAVQRLPRHPQLPAQFAYRPIAAMARRTLAAVILNGVVGAPRPKAADVDAFQRRR